jgi:hypothetical protein
VEDRTLTQNEAESLVSFLHARWGDSPPELAAWQQEAAEHILQNKPIVLSRFRHGGLYALIQQTVESLTL